MSGLEKSLDRYKRLKAESSRTQSSLGFGDRQQYVEDLESQLARISSASQVTLLQQLDRAERHIQVLEDRLATVVASVGAVKDLSEKQSGEMTRLSKLSTDIGQRVAKLEGALLKEDREDSLPALRARLRNVESMCDLEALHRELKRYDELAGELDSALKNSEKTLLVNAMQTYINSRCEEVEFQHQSLQTKWETALSDTATSLSISLKGVERRVAEMQAARDGHSLASSQHEFAKSHTAYDQGVVDLVYVRTTQELDKHIRALQGSFTASAAVSQKRYEEMMEVKRFAVDTKTACAHIIETLDQKVARVEQLALASANTVQRVEEQTGKPLKLADISSRELKALEAQLKQDMSQSIDYLSGLVQKNLSDQASLSDAVHTLQRRLEETNTAPSPVRAFREKREQSLIELRERVRLNSSETHSVTSLKDPVLSVSFDPHESRRPARSQTPISKSLQPTPHGHKSFSPKRPRRPKKLRSKQSSKRPPKPS